MNPIFLLILSLLVACKDTSINEPEIPKREGWTLIWHDEFSSNGLPDPAKWDYDSGSHGWGNQELQDYTARDLETAQVKDGHLYIKTFLIERPNSKTYRSARLVTRGKASWLYGRIEVRAKLPGGRGLWPAIWMLPEVREYGNGGWPDNGEIDIMEYVGFDPGVVHATIHTNARNHMIGTQVGEKMTLPDPENQFHVYALEWYPDRLEVFIDDQLYFTYLNEGEGWRYWPFDKPFHLILNTAVGGTWGGRQGVDDSVFPQEFVIDYVRVYQQE